jgi:hypothetical protein
MKSTGTKFISRLVLPTDCTVSEWKKAPCCLQIRATDSSGGSGFIVDVHQRDQSGLEVRQQFYQMREVDFAIGFDVYKKDRNSKFVL